MEKLKSIISLFSLYIIIISLIITSFGTNLFSLSGIFLVSSVSLGFIAYKKFHTSIFIPLLIISVLLFFSGSIMLLNEVVGVSYYIQIEHDGEYTGGFGSTYLTKEQFTSYNYNIFDLGDAKYVDVGVKKSTDNHKAIKLKILKSRMINLFGYEVIAENVSSEPYGEVLLNIEM